MAAVTSRPIVTGLLQEKLISNLKHNSSDSTNSSSLSYSQNRSTPVLRAHGICRSPDLSLSRLQVKPLARVSATAAPGSTLPDSANQIHEASEKMTVGDVMTTSLVTVRPSTTVDEALEALVDNRITGMPVVDDNGFLIAVVSDYDLLALDSISGKREADTSLFPKPGGTWKAFKEIQKLLLKTRGQVVGDVMTSSPLVVRPMTNLEDAARLLLESKYRRLPVVDENGRLVGLLTRGNVVRAALEMKRAVESRSASH